MPERMTTAQEYEAVQIAIQQLTTLDDDGNRRDIASFTVDGISVSYSARQLNALQERELELARRLSIRNVRKRTTSAFSGGTPTGIYD